MPACTECTGGTILIDGKPATCPLCKGTGTVGTTGRAGGDRR